MEAIWAQPKIDELQKAIMARQLKHECKSHQGLTTQE